MYGKHTLVRVQRRYDSGRRLLLRAEQQHAPAEPEGCKGTDGTALRANTTTSTGATHSKGGSSG